LLWLYRINLNDTGNARADLQGESLYTQSRLALPQLFGADYGVRTRTQSLEDCDATITPSPREIQRPYSTLDYKECALL
jgi:hypothetical protein